MQWNGVRPNPDRPAPLRSLMEILQQKAEPYVTEYGENQIAGSGPLWNSIVRSGTEMSPGVGDLLGAEDLQTAAQNNDWGGIGLGMLAAIPGIPAIGRGVRGEARAARGVANTVADAVPTNQPMSEAEAALARYRAVNPNDTGARVLNPGDQGYPTNAQWDEASQAYVAPVGPPAPQRAPRPERVPSLRPAMRGTDGKIYTADDNHFTAMATMPENVRRATGLNDSYRGFVDDRGRYLNRARAQEYALNFGLLRDDAPSWARNNHELVSEYLRPYEPPALIAPVEPDYPIRAYHGSPHSFDQFELSPRTIGTGEGAQAFGHGLYFAENEGIARGYRDAAVDPDSVPLQFRGKPVDTPWNADIRERWADDFVGLSEDDADAFEELLGNLSQVNNLNDVGNVLGGVSPRARALYNSRVRGDLTKPDFGPGSMYEVGINASPDTFLDWDRPLSQQSEAVRRGYAQARASGDPLVADLLGDLSDPAQMGYAGLFPNSGGAQAYNSLTPEAAEASRRLNEYGINGIRYFDANSRGPAEIYNVGAPTDDFGPYSPYTSMEDANAHLEALRRAGFNNAEIKTQAQPQSSNYVVFNDELVKILRKYGISGLSTTVGASALAEELDRRGQTQEF